MLLRSTPYISQCLPHNFSRRRVAVISMAKQSDDTAGLPQTLAVASGLISTPVIGWSLYTLEMVGWSLYTKSKTGSGLPFGLLGAVEGLSYLALVGILLVFGLQFVQQGFIPGLVPLPRDQCFS